MTRRIWIVTEIFYPNETSTGYYLSKIAEYLASCFEVKVLTVRKPQNHNGNLSPAKELWRGVEIIRCPGTNFDKNRLILRTVNVVSGSVSLLVQALVRFRNSDIILVCTNPPSLPYAMALASRICNAKIILRVDDVYPDALVCSGLLRKENVIVKASHWLQERLFRSVNRIIAMGSCMSHRLRSEYGASPKKITVIQNWADVDEVCPAPREENAIIRALGLNNKFVLQVAGNIGRVQDIETIAKAAFALRADNNIHFLFVGSGAKKEWLEKWIAANDLRNISVVGSKPRSEQQIFLNACDVAIVGLKKGMWGLGVPSRFYNHIAAGKPVIALLDEESEISQVVRKHNIGWVVEPGNVSELVRCIRIAATDKVGLTEMGARARALAEREYSFEKIMSQYDKIVSEVMSDVSS